MKQSSFLMGFNVTPQGKLSHQLLEYFFNNTIFVDQKRQKRMNIIFFGDNEHNEQTSVLKN